MLGGVAHCQNGHPYALVLYEDPNNMVLAVSGVATALASGSIKPYCTECKGALRTELIIQPVRFKSFDELRADMGRTFPGFVIPTMNDANPSVIVLFRKDQRTGGATSRAESVRTE